MAVVVVLQARPGRAAGIRARFFGVARRPELGCSQDRSLACRSICSANDALRPRLPAQAREQAILVPQAQEDVSPGRGSDEHPRAVGTFARGQADAACQSQDRASRGRVLRGRARLLDEIDVNTETRAEVRALISKFMEKWVADSVPAADLERIAREGISPSG